jgi:hypothetical protein
MAYLSPTQGYATAEDFTRWSEQAAKMTIAQLHYAAQDCRKAEIAMRGWNPAREGYYSDQACTFGDELRRRRLV